MKVAIIGTGYVGLPTGVGLAELGNEVICIDRAPSKIERLNNGILTIFEDGLEELFKKNVAQKRIRFTTSMKEGVSAADIVLIAVGTPPHPITKEADMTLIRKKNPTADFDVVSLPEFLREGYAIHDFFNPDRIIIGANSERACQLVQQLYTPFADKTTLLCVKRRSSETIKYASNAFLAMKIHYINEMSNFCEKTGADVFEVAQGMGLDSRIGNKFLNPGPGYGGSCFPKDTNAMAYMARQNGVNLSLIEATIKGNEARYGQMAEKILKAAKSDSPKIGVLGLAFKNGTDDCRMSPALSIVQELIQRNVQLTAYDPKAMDNARLILGDKISYAPDMYEVMKDADVLAILTEWSDFKNIDFSKAAELMKQKVIVDCRNLLNKDQAIEAGFEYQGIGR